MIILIDGVKYILKNPDNEDDLEKIIEKNYKYKYDSIMIGGSI